MTEAEWLACNDPKPMLEFLHGKASERKLRLYACACARRVWDCFAKGKVPLPVGVSERFADGDVKGRELKGVRHRLGALGGVSSKWAANCIEHAVLDDSGYQAAMRAVRDGALFFRLLAIEQPDTTQPHAWLPDNAPEAIAACNAERCKQSALIRECFGNPYDSRTANAAWLAWSDGAIRKLAQAIYDARAFNRLPLLADALEDAGCTDADILSHCRSGGEHVRGCWVVDLLLRKS